MADKQVRAQYTQEFKLEAVRQVKGGQSQLKVAQVLGIPKASLSNWVRQANQGQLLAGVADEKASRVTPEQMEISRLRAEVARLKMERDWAAVVCTASSDSCESRHYEPGPDDVDCPRTGARAARWATTCWTASSGPMARTRSG